MTRLLALAVACVTGLGCATPAAASTPTLPSEDPFYTYSGSLAGVSPGTVLRTRPVTISDVGLSIPLKATQVLYRTTGELGQPTVTVATVIEPLLSGAAPAKLVSYQTAYDALGSECDPSYTLRGGNPGYSTAADEEQLILTYLAAGFDVVVPDYEGTHLDWGAGQESGYGTLDGIRAAESLLRLPAASTPVGMVGYSGGSIATEFASELAPTYARALHIVGVAEGGVPVDFAHNLRYINGSQAWSGVIPAVLVGVGRAFRIDMARYESAYGARIARQVQNECINSFYGDYPGLTVQRLLKPAYRDFLAVPLFAGIIDHLIMGRTGTPREPLFIGVGNADGTGDGVMVAADVQALAHAYCERGVPVQFNQYRGDDHTEAAVPFEAGALTFLTTRLNGGAVADGCASIGPGNSLAPLPVRIRLSMRVLGVRGRLHGLVVVLATNGGRLRGLVVRLRRGAHTVARVRVSSVGAAGRRVVLRVHRRPPPPGTYTVTVSQTRKTLLRRRLKLSR